MTSPTALRAISALGLLAMLALAWLCSEHRREVSWALVIKAMALQFGLGLLVLRTEIGQAFFAWIKAGFDIIATGSAAGAEFLFGNLTRFFLVESAGEPYRASAMYYYRPYTDGEPEPHWVMDISPFMERKLEVLRAFRSQLYNPDYEGEDTVVSSRAVWDSIETRAAYWGGRAGVRYGEPLYADGAIALTSLPGLEGLV